MRVAICTITYNEEQLLGAVLKNWQGKVDKHLVLHSDKPWHGQELPHDKSKEIAEVYGAEFVRLNWRSEKEQRNWGLAYLHDYDYVLMVDADELFTTSDQLKILSTIGKDARFQDNTNVYRAKKIETYFKNTDYVLDPPDSHMPPLVFNPKKVLFKDCRIPDQDYMIPIDVTMHHMTYLRDDLRLFHKLQQFEHHDQVKKDWWNTWTSWKPEHDDVRAYGKEKSKAVLKKAPQEIIDLLEN